MIPEYIILHTAAHGNAQRNYDTTAAQIDEWHRSRDWNMIGYHFVVRLNGDIEPGRPEDKQGAHCRSMGMNRKSLGICFSGNADFHDWTPEQLKAGLKLIRELMLRHGIPGQHVLGHREAGAKKTCPGKLIDMAEVRRVLTHDHDVDVPAIAGTALVDATAMFRHICGIFDDPEFPELPQDTRAKVMELRKAPPFAEITREDLV